jgi:hypothetical protein
MSAGLIRLIRTMNQSSPMKWILSGAFTSVLVIGIGSYLGRNSRSLSVGPKAGARPEAVAILPSEPAPSGNRVPTEPLAWMRYELPKEAKGLVADEPVVTQPSAAFFALVDRGAHGWDERTESVVQPGRDGQAAGALTGADVVSDKASGWETFLRQTIDPLVGSRSGLGFFIPQWSLDRHVVSSTAAELGLAGGVRMRWQF